MKKHLINSILAILFSIALVLSISCLTLLNDNFIIKVMDSNNYYSEVYKSIRVDKNYKCEVDKDKLIKYLNMIHYYQVIHHLNYLFYH